MSKWTISLKLKDLYAIKHAIENTLEAKKQILVVDSLTEINNLKKEDKKRLNKDIVHEEKLLEKIKNEIENFEEYIGRKKGCRGIKLDEKLQVVELIEFKTFKEKIDITKEFDRKTKMEIIDNKYVYVERVEVAN